MDSRPDRGRPTVISKTQTDGETNAVIIGCLSIQLNQQVFAIFYWMEYVSHKTGNKCCSVEKVFLKVSFHHTRSQLCQTKMQIHRYLLQEGA